MNAATCNHDGRCSGRLGYVDGRLVRSTVCDDCGTVTHEYEDREPHPIAPKFA